MIYDLHNDLLTSGKTLFDIETEMKKNIDNGIKPVYAVFTDELKYPMSFCLAVKNAVPQGEFAIEDLGFANIDEIEKIGEIKPFYCGLTWNYDNAIAGGALGTGELTAYGKEVIRKLNQADICIDTAHLNRKSFWQVMEREPKRVICSHTALEFVNSHPRNLTKEQIYAIIMCGGLVGLTFVSDFLTEGEADIDDLTAHILAFLDKFDEDHLALGTDFYGTTRGVKRLDDYSDLGKLRVALFARGVKTSTIDKIFYLNAMRFWSTQ